MIIPYLDGQMLQHLKVIKHCNIVICNRSDPQKDTRAAEREIEIRLGGNIGALYLDNKW